MFVVDYDFEPLPAVQARLAALPVPARAGYRTRIIGVDIPEAGHFVIQALYDRQQFWDPDGKAEALGISPALWPLFGMLWPASMHLATHLARRPIDPSETLLEIGCGLALASMVAHKLGANVTASDCHPLARDFLQTNLKLNALSPSLAYRHGQWGLSAPMTPRRAGQPILEGRFDFIMASDVLYERDCAPAVATFIHEHAMPTAEVWLVDANRGYRPAFNRQMASCGFDLVQDLRLSNTPSAAESNSPPFKGRLLKYQRQA